MNAAYILLGLGTVFLILGVMRVSRDTGRWHPQSKTWLIIAGIFIAVGTWLTLRG
jgi:uncharacterized membrane protein HdeD (DUF308 family)